MKVKLIEIRDKATFIPAVAFELMPDNEAQRYLLGRVGLGLEGSYRIGLVRLSDFRAVMDWSHWGGRTMPAAHAYIEEHFDELHDGDVVDVEHILNETKVRKISERYE